MLCWLLLFVEIILITVVHTCILEFGTNALEFDHWDYSNPADCKNRFKYVIRNNGEEDKSIYTWAEVNFKCWYNLHTDQAWKSCEWIRDGPTKIVLTQSPGSTIKNKSRLFEPDHEKSEEKPYRLKLKFLLMESLTRTEAF